MKERNICFPELVWSLQVSHSPTFGLCRYSEKWYGYRTILSTVLCSLIKIIYPYYILWTWRTILLLSLRSLIILSGYCITWTRKGFIWCTLLCVMPPKVMQFSELCAISQPRRIHVLRSPARELCISIGCVNTRFKGSQTRQQRYRKVYLTLYGIVP